MLRRLLKVLPLVREQTSLFPRTRALERKAKLYSPVDSRLILGGIRVRGPSSPDGQRVVATEHGMNSTLASFWAVTFSQDAPHFDEARARAFLRAWGIRLDYERILGTDTPVVNGRPRVGFNQLNKLLVVLG